MEWCIKRKGCAVSVLRNMHGFDAMAVCEDVSSGLKHLNKRNKFFLIRLLQTLQAVPSRNTCTFTYLIWSVNRFVFLAKTNVPLWPPRLVREWQVWDKDTRSDIFSRKGPAVKGNKRTQTWGLAAIFEFSCRQSRFSIRCSHIYFLFFVGVGWGLCDCCSSGKTFVEYQKVTIKVHSLRTMENVSHEGLGFIFGWQNETFGYHLFDTTCINRNFETK